MLGHGLLPALGGVALGELLAQVLRPLRAALVRLGVLLGLRVARAALLLRCLPLLLGAQFLGVVQLSTISSR
jgi:hypothetical protein